MATNSKIRVGIVGANAQRGFASIAHIPALRALPQFEIVAVCTARQESAEAAARHYGVPLAFSDPEKLARHPDVDLVTVSVKVPDHYRPVMAAIEAGKHVYCEWPLGRDTAEAMRHARCSRTERRAPRGRAAGPDVAGDQLRQGSGRRGLCRAGADRDDDRLRPELGGLDRPRLPGRPRQRRQPDDDHRRAPDRCAVPLPRRIPRADRVCGQPARPDSRSRDRRDWSPRPRPTSSSSTALSAMARSCRSRSAAAWRAAPSSCSRSTARRATSC